MTTLARASLLSCALFASAGLLVGGACNDEDHANHEAHDSGPIETPDLTTPPVEVDMADPVQNANPMLVTVTPALGPTLGGVTITLKGSDFTPGARVSFGGTEASDVKVVSATEITALLPAKPGAWGKVPVKVTLGNGRSSTLTDGFRYYASRLEFQNPASTALGMKPETLGPESMILVDLNGDKKDDLVAALGGANQIAVALGKGDGTFNEVKQIAAGAQPTSVRAADLNADGKPDLVLTSPFVGKVNVLLGKGDGTFDMSKDSAAGSRPMAVVSADFTGDMKEDLAVANFDAGQVTLLVGKGDGTFEATSKTTAVGSRPLALSTADLNGDKKADLLVANFGDKLSILLGKGDGTFDAKAQDAGAQPFGVTTADVNGDGKLDVLVANSGSSTVSVLVGKGDGTFTAKDPAPVGAAPNTVASSDFNGDGYADLVTSDYDARTLTLLLGKGDGTFTAGTTLRGTGDEPYSVTARDLDADGRPDLAAVSRKDGTVRIWLNKAF